MGLGLYISIPFCRSKCTYCNFASGVFPASYFPRYIERLEADLCGIRTLAAQWNAPVPERLDSIYLGGGTPTLLPASLLLRLFASIRAEFAIAPDAEITVECAPGQLEDATLAALVQCSVNRISFGVQSFIDEEAKHSGRLHTRETALRDVARVRAAGIRRLNLDLIAGLPGQTLASWRESLLVLRDTVLRDAAPDHASIYMLEVDDDSRLGRELGAGGLKYYAPQVPPDDAIAEMYSEAVDLLSAIALPQYEISNFAAPGSESRHNLKYWLRRPYLGLGLDAHSMLRDRDGHALRFATTDELNPFLESSAWSTPQRLTRAEEMEEAWFLGLRLNSGISLNALHAEFSREAVDAFAPVLADLISDGLIEQDADRIRLTPQGRLLSNEVFAGFLAEPVPA